MKSSKLFIPVNALALIILPAVLLSQPKIDNDVIRAVQKGDVPSLAIWVANGGDINGVTNNDNTLLMIASKAGDEQVTDYLFSQEADVNARNKVGSTALMMAAKYGHGHIVDILLEKGADPTIRNINGITAARFALAYEHDEIYYQLQEAEIFARSKS